MGHNLFREFPKGIYQGLEQRKACDKEEGGFKQTKVLKNINLKEKNTRRGGDV